MKLLLASFSVSVLSHNILSFSGMPLGNTIEGRRKDVCGVYSISDHKYLDSCTAVIVREGRVLTGNRALMKCLILF